MKIGVLGTGDVGKALGAGMLGLGHEVMMGGRDAANDKAIAWAREKGAGASAGTFADAAAFGELLILATLGSAVEEVLGAAGPANLRGKVVIDATNPLDFSRGFPPRVMAGQGGEMVQRLSPDARVVKAFNSVGHAHMVSPSFPDGPPDMFLCGNDEAAKSTVSEICRKFGWGVIDLGGIEASGYLEAMCMVWVLHAARSGGWNHAFKMLHKA